MSDALLDRIRDLVRGRDICVLATVSGQRPHCSLMAYLADDECGEIYMVTGRQTTKYKNLSANPEVSLLIDTREEHASGNRQNARALTVDGTFKPIEEEGKKRRIAGRFRERHPHLKAIMDDPDSQLVCVKVRSFLLLDGVADAHFVELT
jgi:nitroimidazol reductase NimA-like FMN-containing flavoprotein (pyridoxamine 5'-phosphate oxidase superfamily)